MLCCLLAAACLLVSGPLNANAEESLGPQEAVKAFSPQILENGDGKSLTESPQTDGTARKKRPDYCFYAEEELCIAKEASENQTSPISKLDVHQCQCKPLPTRPSFVYCCNVTHMTQISMCNYSNVSSLHIRNASLIELDLANFMFQTLQSFALTDGNITRLLGSFNKMSPIKCLNVSSNDLLEFPNRALGQAANLKYLDISNNNLTVIPNLNQNSNITVDIASNKYMLCKNLTDVIGKDALKFVEPESSFCLVNNTYNWFNTSDYISIKELELDARFRQECPVIPGFGKCRCAREQMIVMSEQSKLFCRVDCSNLRLIELPPKLPENTFSLIVSNNNISVLGKHFHSNPTYWNIVKLYADNNKISSIKDLEGTKFMEQFQRIYLRNNLIDHLPEYLLSNVLGDSEVGRNIFLGGNKLKCDCQTYRNLKPWLLERSRDIPDAHEIACENIKQTVMKLEEKQVCHTPHDWTDYIYYIIGIEVLMLVALIAKVSYDYWVFKTAGYLPWPASKMPKLPCDWLCE